MIIQNAIFVPRLGKYFKSSHVHDFVSFEIDGKEGFIDGGHEYFRSGGIATRRASGDGIVIYDYRLDENNSILDVLEKLLWGNRGKDGKQPLTYKLIKDLDLEHLKAIKKDFILMEQTDFPGSIHHFVINYWIEEKTK